MINKVYRTLLASIYTHPVSPPPILLRLRRRRRLSIFAEPLLSLSCRQKSKDFDNIILFCLVDCLNECRSCHVLSLTARWCNTARHGTTRHDTLYLYSVLLYSFSRSFFLCLVCSNKDDKIDRFSSLSCTQYTLMHIML